tara:strand:- start:55 stop:216 length:162 start_codon:yes stop_codon:yes gene_type:complete
VSFDLKSNLNSFRQQIKKPEARILKGNNKPLFPKKIILKKLERYWIIEICANL